jgi:hypothetical protein
VSPHLPSLPQRNCLLLALPTSSFQAAFCRHDVFGVFVQLGAEGSNLLGSALKGGALVGASKALLSKGCLQQQLLLPLLHVMARFQQLHWAGKFAAASHCLSSCHGVSLCAQALWHDYQLASGQPCLLQLCSKPLRLFLQRPFYLLR